MAAAPPARRSLIGLIKLGWHELPDIMGGTVLALLGIGMGSFGVWNYYRRDCDNRRFKQQIIVMRPEDPRAARIRND